MTEFFVPKKVSHDHWYKEPWMLLVFGGPLIVVIAGFITFYLAWQGSDPVLSKDYYKQGININKDLYRDAKASEYKLLAKIQLDQATGMLNLNLAGATDLPTAIVLSIASTAPNTEYESIEKTTLSQIKPGVYEGLIKTQSITNLANLNSWQVKIEASDWRLTADWRDPLHRSLQLKPYN